MLPKTIRIEYLIDAERRVGSPLVKADVVQIGQALVKELLVMRPVGFLEKPFTAAQLASKVGELVAHDG